MRRLLIAAATIGLVSPAFGQTEAPPAPTTRQEILVRKRREKAENLEPYEVGATEARLRWAEKAKFPQNWLVKGWRGIRPLIGGMPSGSGLVLGGGYVHGLENQYYQFQVNARRSTRGFTTADAEFVIPPPQLGRRMEIKFRGAYRDLTALSFFGIGNDSSVDTRSSYLQNDRSGTGYFWLNPRGLLSLGAEAGYVSVRTDSSDDDDSVEDVFDGDDIPGFMEERTSFFVTGGWVEFDLRDKWEDPGIGLVARITGTRYEDTGLSEHDFTRLVGDVKGYIPLGSRNRILALRARTSQSYDDEGKNVPFYMMETLGGATTVRGFREWRFRDERNLYLSAEYRWEVMPYIDFTLFFDAGKVFEDLDDFNLDKMHTGYGFGIRTHTPGGMVLRFDLANSTEGLKFHISGGPTF